MNLFQAFLIKLNRYELFMFGEWYVLSLIFLLVINTLTTVFGSTYNGTCYNSYWWHWDDQSTVRKYWYLKEEKNWSNSIRLTKKVLINSLGWTILGIEKFTLDHLQKYPERLPKHILITLLSLFLVPLHSREMLWKLKMPTPLYRLTH